MASTSQEMVEFYTEAEIAVLKGQSFRHGERMLTLANLEEIRKGRREWQNLLNAEQRSGTGRYAVANFGGTT